MSDTLSQISTHIAAGRHAEVKKFTEQAVAQGLPPGVILQRGLIAGMDVVGEKFQQGEYFIPHMLIAARAMQAALDILRPLLADTGAEPAGRIVLGTVHGDHHDIGKNLVRMMFEGKGFDVVDLGIDVAAGKFVEAAAPGVHIVAMSALLSTTAPFIRETIDALQEAGVRNRIKVIIGGGVVTQDMADDFGADAYAGDAATGAVKALELMAAFS